MPHDLTDRYYPYPPDPEPHPAETDPHWFDDHDDEAAA